MFKNFCTLTRRHVPVAALALLALVPVFAQAAPQLVDSTGIKKTVISTIVMPAAGLTENNVATIIQNHDAGVTSSSVPAGYTEVSVAMGPHSIGDGSGTYGLGYYTGLGYSVYSPAVGTPDPCGGNLTSPQRLVGTPGGMSCSGGDSELCTPYAASYWVCEPVGTRTSLQKVVGGNVLNVTQAMFNAKAAQYPGSVGIALMAATPYCQSLGYTNYVPGTIVTNAPGACDQLITRWNGAAFYNDSACYNNILYSMQCWK